jgi:hypothetical protein
MDCTLATKGGSCTSTAAGACAWRLPPAADEKKHPQQPVKEQQKPPATCICMVKAADNTSA